MITLVDALGFVSGGLVGFVLGLIGGGGSILAVPLLVYGVGVATPHVAIGTSAVAVGLAALANLIGPARAGLVKWRCAVLFAIAGVVGAIGGSTLGKQVDGQMLLTLFGLLMLVIAAATLFKADSEGNPDVRLTRTSAPVLAPLLSAYGVAVGTLSGFFGIGGGFLVVPGLMAATGMPIVNAIASSLVAVAAFGFTTAANYTLSGFIDWRLVAVFVAGGIVGGLGGRWLTTQLARNRRHLTRVFASIVGTVGLYVVWRGVAALTA